MRFFKNVFFAVLILICSILVMPGRASASMASFTVGSSSYTVDGMVQPMDVAPYVKDGRTYVPVAYLASAFNVNSVSWDNINSMVTMVKGDTVVQIKIGSNSILVNGTAIKMDVVPEITQNRTFLPAAWVAMAFKYPTQWDSSTRTVTISSGNSPNNPANPVLSEDNVLTPDYWIPDTNKTYIYDAVFNELTGTNRPIYRQKTITWLMNTGGLYARQIESFNRMANGTLEIYGSHHRDTFIRDGNTILWKMEEGCVDQAGSWIETMVSGTNVILKPIKPGQTWSNDFTTTLGMGSGDHYNETVTFIGFEERDCLGIKRQAAHIKVEGRGPGLDRQYISDFWYVKGMGMVENSEIVTTPYQHLTETTKLSAVR